jgi:hypothetical protein
MLCRAFAHWAGFKLNSALKTIAFSNVASLTRPDEDVSTTKDRGGASPRIATSRRQIFFLTMRGLSRRIGKSTSEWRLEGAPDRHTATEVFGARSQLSSIEVKLGDQQSSEDQQDVSTSQHDSQTKCQSG